MITMIFEKTLARKVVGSVNLPPGQASAQSSEVEQSGSWWRGIVGRFRIFSSAQEVKEPASMGKILNMMRYVIEPAQSAAFR